MMSSGKKVMVCSCEGSMPIDRDALAAGLGACGPVFHDLCQGQLHLYRQALAEGHALLVTCTQQEPLFAALAEAEGVVSPVCVDIRDRAGWSSDGARAGAKMAALIAAAAVEAPLQPPLEVVSSGAVLVLGAGEAALETAARLAGDRPVQLVLTGDGSGLTPPDLWDYPLRRGRVVSVSGSLGRWVVRVAELARPRPSSRQRLLFGPAQAGIAEIAADVVIDLTREPALVRARDGWLRADPLVPAQVEWAIAKALAWQGEFDRPRHLAITGELCAHARNGQVACTRCMDACPSSALSAKGNQVVVDHGACCGHGACAAACPTGAIVHRGDAPAVAQLAVLLDTFARAGGAPAPVLLIHDSEEGAATLAALARFGAGLAAHVLPLAVPAVAAVGPDLLWQAAARGVGRVLVLVGPRGTGELSAVLQGCELANLALAGLGWGTRCQVLVSQDPDELAAALAPPPAGPAVVPPCHAPPQADRRGNAVAALAYLLTHAPRPEALVPLAQGAAFGAVLVDQGACSLCMACVPVCPAAALSATQVPPTLSFTETLCTQCGLCRVTCPERAITLAPRLNFAETAACPQVLMTGPLAACLRCGMPFAPQAGIDRMVRQLSGQPMFETPERVDLLRMCPDCRSEVCAGAPWPPRG